MTTIAQVRQVVRPLLERNSDLALVGRLIVIKPVHHLLFGVYVDRSFDPLSFVPTWSVILLSDLQKSFGFLWSQRVRGRHGTWKTTDPDLSSAMCEAIEQEALGPMRSIKTFEDFIDLTSKLRNPRRHLDLFPIARLTVDIARGDLAAAEVICEYLKTKAGKSEYVYQGEGTGAPCKNSTHSSLPTIERVSRSSCAGMRRSQELKDREILGADAVSDRAGVLSVNARPPGAR